MRGKTIMRALIVSMAAMAETGGPVSRSVALAMYLKDKGIEVATCIAEDVNYKKIDGITNYYLDVPMPMGMPSFIGKNIFPIVQKLGVTYKKTVNSFDEVLFLTGNLNYRYLKKSIESLRNAINDYKPDVVYSEFNISAMIAAKLEGVKLFVTSSFPTRYEYSHNTHLSKGLNRLLNEFGLDSVESALCLFEYADKKFCLSVEELEPMDNVIHCGSWKTIERVESKVDKILVYMGNGTIPAKKMKNVIVKALSESEYEIYIASSYLTPCDKGNIHIDKRYEFDKLLNEAVLFINHGGQNSVIQGLQYGVPQLIVPGKVFERKYNAKSVSDLGAAIVLDENEFVAPLLAVKVNEIVGSFEMKNNAKKLGEKLNKQGGFDKILKKIQLL